tara:strand:- start:16518 stop:17354 length:837 start_codon:yes stop_codon:yes gene_type:complete
MFDKIVWLNGMPRSGTSWLSQIFDSHPSVAFRLSPLFSYRFKNQVDSGSSLCEWRKFFEEVYKASDDGFINQTDKREAGFYPTFERKDCNRNTLVIKDTRYHNLTSSVLEMFPDIRFIHIVRHPCAAINSWLRAPREFPQNLNPLEQWRSGACRKTSKEEFWGFDDWVELTKRYLDFEVEFPQQVKVISYDKLVRSPVAVVREMFDFVGMIIPQQTLDFLKISQESNVDSEYAVFKNKEQVLNRWEAELHPQIIKEIKLILSNTELECFVRPCNDPSL